MSLGFPTAGVGILCGASLSLPSAFCVLAKTHLGYLPWVVGFAALSSGGLLTALVTRPRDSLMEMGRGWMTGVSAAVAFLFCGVIPISAYSVDYFLLRTRMEYLIRSQSDPPSLVDVPSLLHGLAEDRANLVVEAAVPWLLALLTAVALLVLIVCQTLIAGHAVKRYAR